ncbi:MAG: hypothetical protein ABJE47_25715 [bacterium]
MITEPSLKAATPASIVGTLNDPILKDYLGDMRADSRVLAAELRSTYTPLSASGRRISGQIASLLLVGFLVAAGVIWWNYSAGGESFRQGMAAGSAAAKTKG